MEEFNQEYFEYKISINIFEQAIVYLSIKLFQFFIIINKNLNIRLCFKIMLTIYSKFKRPVIESLVFS